MTIYSNFTLLKKNKNKIRDLKMNYDILIIALILYYAVMFVFAILYLND